MALVIEDGTGKTDSNSFASVAEAISYAADRGFDFPSVTADVEKLLIQAGDFILSFEEQFQGYRTNQNQRLSFPRVNVLMYKGVDYVGADEIPNQLKEAQMRFAVSANGGELRPDGTGQEVIKEKVGPLEVQYAERGSGSVTPQFSQGMDLLEPMFRHSGLQLSVSRA